MGIFRKSNIQPKLIKSGLPDQYHTTPAHIKNTHFTGRAQGGLASRRVVASCARVFRYQISTLRGGDRPKVSIFMSRMVAGPVGEFQGSKWVPEVVREVCQLRKSKMSRLKESKFHRPLSQTTRPDHSQNNQVWSPDQSDTGKSTTLRERQSAGQRVGQQRAHPAASVAKVRRWVG